MCVTWAWFISFLSNFSSIIQYVCVSQVYECGSRKEVPQDVTVEIFCLLFIIIYLAKKKKILDLVCWNNRFVIKNLFLSLFVSKNLKNITSE